MTKKTRFAWLPMVAWAAVCLPAHATVHITSLSPTLATPQQIGTTVGWGAKATDSNAGPIMFRFTVTAPDGSLSVIKNFLPGTLASGVWKSTGFSWALTGTDGNYQVQVVAKDFTSGESDTKTISYIVTTPVIGSTPVVQATQNPIVALFTAPPCSPGSTQRVWFQLKNGKVPATTTNWLNCEAGATLSFEIAGMYPSAPYNLHAEVNTGGNIVKGPTVSFTTGALPTSTINFPVFHGGVQDSPSDPYRTILHAPFDVRVKTTFPHVATDLSGNIIWYYYQTDKTNTSQMTRPLQNGYLALEYGPSWAPGVQEYQVVREFDWAGNLVRETNAGIVQQQLLAMGNPDAQPCNKIPRPPPVGSACLGIFHHDAIQTLPNGYTAVITDVEKIFPPGTQGDTSGLPVNIVGDMIVVLDQNWNAVWYWDAFNPNGGGNGYPQLPVSRTAVLNETCTAGTSQCLILFLLGNGISPTVHDWLHTNSIYYWPNDGKGAPTPGDIIWSSRHQDWVMKIDYRDGAGTGNILWRLGPSGDFSFQNTYNDPWPWFSHQHEAGIENGGLGVMTILDNGNTRVSSPGASTGGVPGLGSQCGPNDCDTRGIALTINESSMQAFPVMNADLGYYSNAMGSAQLLDDGNYFFLAAIARIAGADTGIDIQILPTPGTATGTQVMTVSGPASYRSWELLNLYSPPTT